MESVRYKKHRIEIKYYPAFRHSHRVYPEIFDYIIFNGGEKICKGYAFNSTEEAIAGAKRFIDRLVGVQIT